MIPCFVCFLDSVHKNQQHNKQEINPTQKIQKNKTDKQHKHHDKHADTNNKDIKIHTRMCEMNYCK